MAQKIAVITSPTRRMAMSRVAQRLLQGGFTIVINRTRDAREAAALVGRLRRTYRGAVIVHVDAEPADVQ